MLNILPLGKRYESCEKRKPFLMSRIRLKKTRCVSRGFQTVTFTHGNACCGKAGQTPIVLYNLCSRGFF